MNRREFLAAHAGALYAANSGFDAPVSEANIPRAKWIEDGLIDAGGSHEPYSFIVRRGGERQDAYRRYQQADSEDVIRRLKDRGVEVYHTHLYKGAGMAQERAEMEDAKRVAAIAHRYGLRVDSYIQWNTMMYETFFAEEPRAKNWIQRDDLGKPIMLTYGYQQSFRYRPCFANPEYLEYLGKIVRFAVEEVKSDFIHFDNFNLNPEPDSCHCPNCVNGFRLRLRTKYSAALRKERFGFENVDYVNPPSWNRENPPEKMDIIFDPAIQEWIDFRCQLMTDALAKMAALAKSLNSEVVIEVNPHGINGGNRAWEAGLDHSRFLKYTQVFWTEERNPPDFLPDGRLISTIRTYKLARRYNNFVFSYLPDAAAIAESLAFNHTLGFAGTDPLSADMKEHIVFYRANRHLYTAAVDAGNVALLRSYASIAYHQSRAQLSAILFEQALIESKIPFDLIFDEHLADLSKYSVLILPDSECLSEAQLTAIREFAARGGGLIASGAAGMYDEWRRLRTEPGLRSLLPEQPTSKAYEETVAHESASSGVYRHETGAGRVVYFRSVPFDGPLPPANNYFAINRRFWKAPANTDEIAESVRWAAREEIPIRVDGPRFLVANLTAQSAKQRWLVHLINYNKNVPAVEAVKIECRLPEGTRLKQVSIISPDHSVLENLPFQFTSNTAILTIPRVNVYAIAVLSW
ncbi:MAG TPA: beta-galactosidase trimerization domain-containing protein [Bryobacteraceae bacterium]|jgi:hypothetical protein